MQAAGLDRAGRVIELADLAGGVIFLGGHREDRVEDAGVERDDGVRVSAARRRRRCEKFGSSPRYMWFGQ